MPECHSPEDRQSQSGAHEGRRHPSRAFTNADQLLVRVRAMRLDHRFARRHAPNEGFERISEEQGHSDGRCENSVGLVGVRSQKGQRCQQKTQKTAPDVAHEDACGCPVVNEKTDGRTSDAQRHGGCIDGPARQHHPDQRSGGLSAGKTVDTIHEVEEVRDRADPNDRQDPRNRGGKGDRQGGRQRDGVKWTYRADNGQRGRDLHQQPQAGRQPPHVIDQADDAYGDRRGENDHDRRSGVDTRETAAVTPANEPSTIPTPPPRGVGER